MISRKKKNKYEIRLVTFLKRISKFNCHWTLNVNRRWQLNAFQMWLLPTKTAVDKIKYFWCGSEKMKTKRFSRPVDRIGLVGVLLSHALHHEMKQNEMKWNACSFVHLLCAHDSMLCHMFCFACSHRFILNRWTKVHDILWKHFFTSPFISINLNLFKNLTDGTESLILLCLLMMFSQIFFNEMNWCNWNRSNMNKWIKFNYGFDFPLFSIINFKHKKSIKKNLKWNAKNFKNRWFVDMFKNLMSLDQAHPATVNDFSCFL